MQALKNDKHECFCQLVAKGEKPYKAYEMAGYGAKSRQTGYRLLKKPHIAERITELKPLMEERRAQVIDAVIDTNLRNSAGRIEALIKTYLKLERIVAARAQFDDSQTVPGGDTGLIATGFKAVGGTIVQTHELDTGLLREMREITKQIAIELGQWAHKPDSTIRTIEEIPTDLLKHMITEGRRLRAEKERKAAEEAAAATKKESVQ